MAITAPTKLSDFSGFLNREQSQPIFEKAAAMSVVQRLAQEVPLGITGKAIPVITSSPTATWVAEGAKKSASQGSMSLKTMDPKKLATIFVVSEEVVRANPGGFMQAMEAKVAEAFAVTYDDAALHGVSTPFSQSIADTTKSQELGGATVANGGVWTDLVAGLAELVAADKELTGWAMSTKAEPRLLGAVDSNGRPIFAELPTGEDTAAAYRNARLMARPVAISKTVHHGDATVELIGGDWDQAAWGVIGGINYSVSTEATVTINGSLVSLWEQNLVAVRAEAEYGFVVNDVDAFCMFTNNSGS